MTPFLRARRQTFTPLLTPFSSGVIDSAAFEASIDRQIRAGIDGIVVGDVIGEGPTLSEAEHKQLLAACISGAGRHLSVIAATGTNCTQTTVARCQRAQALGADALLVTVPYYSRPTLKGVIAHFRDVAAAVSIPIIIDDDPGRTAKDVGPALLDALAAFDIVQAICHGPDRLASFAGLSPALKSRFMHLSRDDASAPAFLALGGSGLVSPVANIIPSDLQAMVAMSEGSREAGSLSQTMVAAISAAGSQDIAALKEAAFFIDQFPTEMRLPLVCCGPEVVIRVRHGFAPFARCEVSGSIAA